MNYVIIKGTIRVLAFLREYFYSLNKLTVFVASSHTPTVTQVRISAKIAPARSLDWAICLFRCT